MGAHLYQYNTRWHLSQYLEKMFSTNKFFAHLHYFIEKKKPFISY